MADREIWLATTILELSDALDASTGEDAYGYGLISRLAEVLAPAEVALLLADVSGQLKATAASTARAGALISLDAQRGGGPGSYSYRTGRSVLNYSLTATTPWPRYASVARADGLGFVSALPVQRRDEVIGAVCTFSAGNWRLGPQDADLIAVLANAAATGIIQHRVFHEAAFAAQQIRRELDQRVLTEQATGAVAAWLGVRVNVAADLMLAFAKTRGLAPAEVAERILRGKLSARALLPAPRAAFPGPQSR